MVTTKPKNLLILPPVVISLFYLGAIFAELSGKHVCQDEVRYLVNVTRHFLRNITVRDYEWCLQVPPRCSTFKVQQINDSRTVEEERVKYVKICCNGYKPSHRGDFCVSESCPNCVNGFCNKTQTCDCEPGFEGINCSKECDTGFWGKDCTQECNCGDQGICDKRSGKCYCPPIQSFNGLRCEPTCSRDKPDHECKFQCICFPVKENTSSIFDTTTEDDFTTQNDASSEEVKASSDEIDSEERTNYLLVKNGGQTQYDMPKSVLVTKPWKTVRRSSSYPYSYFTTENYKPPTMHGFEISIKSSTEETINPKKTIIPSLGASVETINHTTPKLPETAITFDVEERNISQTDIYPNGDNLIIDSRLFITVLSAVLFSVLVILVASAFCVLHKLKERKRKCEMKIKEKEAASPNIPSVSVTARSIFHTPLPEPPTFQNPVFSLPVDSNLQPSAIEVVCNMNFPKNTSYKQEDFFYDHPPSTGSYRAASIPEPPTPTAEKLANFDPIYDEIPNQRKQMITPPPSYVSEKSTLYMNTR